MNVFLSFLKCLRKGVTIEEIHEATDIDYFFLHSFASLIEIEKEIASVSIAGCNKRRNAVL